MKVRYLLFMLFIMASALNLRANNATWDYNPYAFQYDMSVYVELASVDGKNITDGSDYQIAAFCDEECRGIAEEKAIEDNKYVYLRIRSNKTEGEIINFRVKNTTTGKVAKVSETIEFKFQQIVGYPSNPFLINAKNQYNVTFIIDGTENRYPSYYGDQITAPTDLNKEGHTFSKWVPDIDSTVPDHDVTYTATYTINQYTITFDTDGGSEIAPITQDYNSTVTAPADPAKTGYTFSGWDKEIPATMPAEDITIKALWTVNQYTVSFVVDGETVKEETLDYGSNITAPENPTKIGYTFTGWDPAVDVTVPDHDVTYVAQFSISPEVNFVAIDNSGSETVSILKPGDSIELTDGDYKSVSVTEDVDDVDISYTRSFSSTDWQALYVPFALNVSTDLAGFDVYEFSSASEDVVYVSKVESTTTEPNTPYFIRAKESTGSKTFTLTGTTLVATQECKVGTSYFDVMGTYAKLEYSDVDATWYALKDGKFLIAGEGAVLNPFRFYLKKKGTASVKDCINIVFEGSTDISTFGKGKEMEGSSFNIAGQAVDVDYKGIVIINGKKIFKK